MFAAIKSALMTPKVTIAALLAVAALIGVAAWQNHTIGNLTEKTGELKATIASYQDSITAMTAIQLADQQAQRAGCWRRPLKSTNKRKARCRIQASLADCAVDPALADIFGSVHVRGQPATASGGAAKAITAPDRMRLTGCAGTAADVR